MPLYRVDRRFGTLPAAAVEAAGYRVMACLPRFPGVRWIRSLWDRKNNVLTCTFEAPNADAIRRHAEAAGVPCDDVAEVEEIVPASSR